MRRLQQIETEQAHLGLSGGYAGDVEFDTSTNLGNVGCVGYGFRESIDNSCQIPSWFIIVLCGVSRIGVRGVIM